jgi:hypothetical protein
MEFQVRLPDVSAICSKVPTKLADDSGLGNAERQRRTSAKAWANAPKPWRRFQRHGPMVLASNIPGLFNGRIGQFQTTRYLSYANLFETSTKFSAGKLAGGDEACCR